MRSILVHADRGPAMGNRLDSALALARCTGGHLTVVVDTPLSRYIAMDPMGGSYIAADALQQALEQDDVQAADITARLARGDVPFDVVRSEEEPVDAILAAARLADVVVVSQGTPMAGELALNARCPILATPRDRALDMPVEVACVAWDGGAEGAIALKAAVPLLARCQQVHVVTVAAASSDFPATDALRYLSRHGVSAELEELSRASSIEETLSAATQRLGADLLVMGAYGHSRVREYLFGGVTRYFLEQVAGPALLLAH